MSAQLTCEIKPLLKGEGYNPGVAVSKNKWDEWARRFDFDDYDHLKESGCTLEVNWTKRELILEGDVEVLSYDEHDDDE